MSDLVRQLKELLLRAKALEQEVNVVFESLNEDAKSEKAQDRYAYTDEDCMIANTFTDHVESLIEILNDAPSGYLIDMNLPKQYKSNKGGL